MAEELYIGAAPGGHHRAPFLSVSDLCLNGSGSVRRNPIPIVPKMCFR